MPSAVISLVPTFSPNFDFLVSSPILLPSVFRKVSFKVVARPVLLRASFSFPSSAVVVIAVSPVIETPSLSVTSPVEPPSPFIANFESPTALVTLVVNLSFVTTFVPASLLSPLSNVYVSSPALIVKSPPFSVVIELMFLRSFDKPTTILPVVSILVIMFLPLSKLAHVVFAASPLIEICVPSLAVCSPEFATNFKPLSVEFLISVKASFKTFSPVPPQPLAGASMYGSAEPSSTLSFLRSPPKISFKCLLYFLS